MSFRQNERNRERGKKKTIRVPSLSGPRLSRAGLGKRTKQRVRESSPRRERESEVSSQQFGRPAVYLEILGFSPK